MLLKSLTLLTICLAVSGISAAQDSRNPAPTSGIDVKAIDTSVNPCVDFYQYACGAWMQANPVRPQYASWGRFNELAERNRQELRAILEDSQQHQNRSPIDQKIGAFYQACMDEAAIEKAG